MLGTLRSSGGVDIPGHKGEYSPGEVVTGSKVELTCLGVGGGRNWGQSQAQP